MGSSRRSACCEALGLISPRSEPVSERPIYYLGSGTGKRSQQSKQVSRSRFLMRTIRARGMGRNSPPPAGTSQETVAGRKRRGAPLNHSKRPPRASDGWATLPTDIVILVLRWLLLACGGDVVDYIAFRAVCFYWRACTPPPSDTTLRDTRLRPRGWVALCGGDAVRPDDAREIAFFNTRTARRLRVHLPELKRHRIVGFTDGLVILLHRTTTAVRVLHPFTRVAVDLPPLARAYRKVIGRWKRQLLEMNAVVCGSARSANSIAVAVWFRSHRTVVLAAEPDDPDWKVIHRGRYVWSMLSFQGKVYATLSPSREIVQLYPPPLDDSRRVVARIPNMFAGHIFCESYLVESGGQMLVADRHPPGHAGFEIYAVRLGSGGGGGTGELIRVKCIGDRALFLGMDRCLSVSARDLPSLSGNSIYFSLLDSPVVLHSLATGSSERLAEHCQIHDKVNRIRPSVRPFTIADHLLTYCHPQEWAEGLMFHEYHYIPESFKELRDSIEAKKSKLRIPSDRTL